MLVNKSVDSFTMALSSASPVPGGGGASALAGALGIALGSMVANLTLGKKKYEDVQEDIKRILKKAAKLQKALLDLIDEDAESFEPLSKAYGLPRNTEKEIAEREKILETCLRAACVVPEKIINVTMEVLNIHEELAVKGSKIVLSDVGVGAALCRAAIEGAALNIYVNTKLLKDRKFADELNLRIDKAVKDGTGKASEIYEKVLSGLRS